MATASARIYRPRHPQRTALYRVLAQHFERFTFFDTQLIERLFRAEVLRLLPGRRQHLDLSAAAGRLLLVLGDDGVGWATLSHRRNQPCQRRCPGDDWHGARQPRHRDGVAGAPLQRHRSGGAVGVSFDVLFSDRLVWRAAQPDILLTGYGDDTQTNFRILSAIVVRL